MVYSSSSSSDILTISLQANQYIGLGVTPQAVLTLAFAEIANSRCGSKRREEWMGGDWRRQVHRSIGMEVQLPSLKLI